MPYDGQAADLFGNSCALLSQRDMSDDQNVKDAAFELERAQDDHQLARWARRWGSALIASAHASAGRDPEEWVSASDVEEIESDLKSEKERADELEDGIRKALTALEAASEHVSGHVERSISSIISTLENAL